MTGWNPIELKSHVEKLVEEAIKNANKQIKITISKSFPKDSETIEKYVKELEIKQTTEYLIKRFDKFEIKSIIGSEGVLSGVICFFGGCSLGYPLVWTITLNPKKITEG